METKEFYQSLMAVIEYIAAGHSEVTCEKGEELSGEYWPRIYRLFSNEHVGVGISGGDFHITQPQYLSPIYADCGHALEEIGKREADRQLDNRVKECPSSLLDFSRGTHSGCDLACLATHPSDSMNDRKANANAAKAMIYALSTICS